MSDRWQSIDLREDIDELRYQGDPADLLDVHDLMAELTRRPAWHQDAACRGQKLEPWFVGRGCSIAPAKAICASCPVRDECLEAGMSEHQGVWGGLSEAGRRQLRRLSPTGDIAA